MKVRFVALGAAAILAAAVSGAAYAQGPAGGATVFPNAVDAKYSKETPGRARMHTCLDQYRANKKNNGNGGLKWLAKNGYYSQCSKKLKGTS